ncbi:MAG: prenyltransferase [Candidatus Methanoplasma sp.]|jgi:1,4-dihydroxy-2-naphthoate octaprenyltransferase|nr:prenyltransferase [Candidatus Methanoplasma sp.]
MEHASGEISFMRRVNLIFRFSYTLAFFMASVCGSLFAFLFYDPPLHIVVLIPVVVLLLAIFVNFSNDYFDHRSGVDRIRFEKIEEMKGALDSELLKKIYWEGNPFDNGLVTDRQGRIVMAALLCAAVVLSVPIILYGGWIVAVFGAVGIFLSYYYTAPPIDFGARGLGEADVAISFFMLVFCSFYVATVDFDAGTFMFTGIFDIEIFVFAVMIGILVGLMRLVDSMSGMEAHIANNERSIPVRFGYDGAVKIAKALVIISYIIAAAMVCLNPVYALIFLTLPLPMRAWKIMKERGENWRLKLPPMFFGTAFFSYVLFIIAIVLKLSFGIGSLF